MFFPFDKLKLVSITPWVFPKPTSPTLTSVDGKSSSHQPADLLQVSLMNGCSLCHSPSPLPFWSRMKYESSLYYTLKVKAVAGLTK